MIKNENITTQRNLKNLNRVTNLKNCAKNQKIYVKNAQNKKNRNTDSFICLIDIK